MTCTVNLHVTQAQKDAMEQYAASKSMTLEDFIAELRAEGGHIKIYRYLLG